MKILILQASPRANGNTAWMAEEYKKAAEAAGHEVTLVNVSKKKVRITLPGMQRTLARVRPCEGVTLWSWRMQNLFHVIACKSL